MMPDERFVRFRETPGIEWTWGRCFNDSVYALSGPPWSAEVVTIGDGVPLNSVALGPPASPTKIIALGYNYKDLFLDASSLSRRDEPHFDDEGFEPLVFLKGLNTLVGTERSIEYPSWISEMWVEVELAIVIGRQCRNVPTRTAARDVVFGTAIANDISATNILQRDWHLARSKSLDGFCPLGPFLIPGIDDWPLSMRTMVNGRVTQEATTANRVLDTLDSVILVSKLMTLEEGDVILTGTPRGGRQSVVRRGDRVEMEIEGRGRLVNHIGGPEVSMKQNGHLDLHFKGSPDITQTE
jgi:2-keto-4-pentenoate hydratase/2-oxohepta-3-ene-1,7-dioic acid hydratase in catechol pathway